MAVIIKTIEDVAVASAGTAQQISSSNRPVISITFQAHPSNTGNIYVGDSDVASDRGYALGAGEAIEFVGDPRFRAADEFILSDFYADADVNGEKVKVEYIIRRPGTNP